MLISSLITGRICHISCLIYAILKWCKNKNIDLFRPSMEDEIQHCDGENCKIKDKCLRYTAEYKKLMKLPKIGLDVYDTSKSIR